jgi:hypothetical protein
MRNELVQPLAAGTTLTINIDPPMEDDERYFLVVPAGRELVVVRPINNGCVSITNPTKALVLIIFGVTRLPRVSPELLEAVSAFFHKVRS